MRSPVVMAGQMFAVFWCLLALGHLTAASLRLDVFPSVIAPGISSSLTVNCTFSHDGTSNLANLIVLIISMAKVENNVTQSSQELVSVNYFIGSDQVNELAQTNASFVGHIDASQESYLTLEWSSPSENQIGIYECKADGMDHTGHPVELTETAEVTLNPTDPSEVMEILENQGKQLAALEQQVASQAQTIQDLQAELQKQEKNYSDALAAVYSAMNDMQKNFTQLLADSQAQTSAQWNAMVYAISASEEFDISEVYNGHIYLLSHEEWKNATAHEEKCERYGGYLVEIDDPSEHYFIRNFLGHDMMTYILVGGTDEDQEGQWIWRKSRKPVTYTDWASSYHNTDAHDCMEIASGSFWQMDAFSCTHTFFGYHFLCEVPLM